MLSRFSSVLQKPTTSLMFSKYSPISFDKNFFKAFSAYKQSNNFKKPYHLALFDSQKKSFEIPLNRFIHTEQPASLISPDSYFKKTAKEMGLDSIKQVNTPVSISQKIPGLFMDASISHEFTLNEYASHKIIDIRQQTTKSKHDSSLLSPDCIRAVNSVKNNSFSVISPGKVTTSFDFYGTTFILEMIEDIGDNEGNTLTVHFKEKLADDMLLSGQIKQILFLKLMATELLSENSFYDIDKDGRSVDFNLELTNIENIKKSQQGFIKICNLLPLLENFSGRHMDVKLEALPRDMTYDDLINTLHTKPANFLNQTKEYLLFYSGLLASSDTIENLKNSMEPTCQDAQLLEYILLLKQAYNNTNHMLYQIPADISLPEIPAHFDPELTLRLQKYLFSICPNNAFSAGMVTEDMINSCETLIPAIASGDCISEIEKAGGKNTLKKIGETPELLAECTGYIENLTPYVSISPEDLKKITHKWYYDNPSFIVDVLNQERYQSLTQDEIFIKALVRNIPWFHSMYLLEQHRDNHEVMMTAISDYGAMFSLASKSLQDNKEFVAKALKNSEGLNAYKFIDPKFKNDRELTLSVLPYNIHILKEIPETFKNDPSFIKELFAHKSFDDYKYNIILTHMGDSLKKDKAFVSEILIKHNIGMFKDVAKGFPFIKD